MTDKTELKPEEFIQKRAAELKRLSALTEAEWVREKLRLPHDAPTGDVMGRMHQLDASARGYDTYIKAYKCDDKQGEIARLTVENGALRDELALLDKPQASTTLPNGADVTTLPDAVLFQAVDDRCRGKSDAAILARELRRRMDKPQAEAVDVEKWIDKRSPVCEACGEPAVSEEDVRALAAKLGPRGEWVACGDAWEKYPREVLRAFTAACQDADRRFEKDGSGGTKTWVREYLIPELEKARLALCLLPPLPEGER